MAKIAPSILGADFAHLADDIASAELAGIQIYHLDIMDGHFVPNLSFGPGVVKTINGLTDKFLDVHLMLSEPEKYFEPFVKAGADNITFHLEVHPDPRKNAAEIKGYGIKAGISINPDMPVEKVLPYLPGIRRAGVHDFGTSQDRGGSQIYRRTPIEDDCRSRRRRRWRKRQ